MSDDRVMIGSMTCQNEKCKANTPIVLGKFKMQYVICHKCRTVYKVSYENNAYYAVPQYTSEAKDPLDETVGLN